jgi:thiol-disulfide isomerase/thioredoxin
MKRAQLFCYILVIAVQALLAQTKTANLIGDVKGIKDGKIYVAEGMSLSTLEGFRDSMNVMNGHFEYSVNSNDAVIIAITSEEGIYLRKSGGKYMLRSKSLFLFLKPDDRVHIKGVLNNDYLDYMVEGSEVNSEYHKLKQNFKKEEIEFDNIELKIDSLIYAKSDTSIVNKLFRERVQKGRVISKAQRDYIQQNPDKELAAYYLAMQNFDNFNNLYSKLTEKVKNGVFKNLLAATQSSYLEYAKVKEAEKMIKVGNVAPDFTLKGLNGKDISLSDIKGKMIVLDFWGSWCGPCIGGIPKMKEYYERYKSKIEFIGIDCREEPAKWKEAVEKYKLPWLHLINGTVLDANISIMYAIEAYPTKIIIDKDKKILAIYIGEKNEFYEKLDELLK